MRQGGSVQAGQWNQNTPPEDDAKTYYASVHQNQQDLDAAGSDLMRSDVGLVARLPSMKAATTAALAAAGMMDSTQGKANASDGVLMEQVAASSDSEGEQLLDLLTATHEPPAGTAAVPGMNHMEACNGVWLPGGQSELHSAAQPAQRDAEQVEADANGTTFITQPVCRGQSADHSKADFTANGTANGSGMNAVLRQGCMKTAANKQGSLVPEASTAATTQMADNGIVSPEDVLLSGASQLQLMPSTQQASEQQVALDELD